MITYCIHLTVHMVPNSWVPWYWTWIYWFWRICPCNSQHWLIGLVQDFQLTSILSLIRSRFCCFVHGNNMCHRVGQSNALHSHQCCKEEEKPQIVFMNHISWINGFVWILYWKNWKNSLFRQFFEKYFRSLFVQALHFDFYSTISRSWTTFLLINRSRNGI